MSDTMLLGVLRMPRELRETDVFSRMQFEARVLEAANELEKRAEKIKELEGDPKTMGAESIPALLEQIRLLQASHPFRIRPQSEWTPKDGPALWWPDISEARTLPATYIGTPEDKRWPMLSFGKPVWVRHPEVTE